MSQDEATCRIRIQLSNTEPSHFLPISTDSLISPELRSQWAKSILEHCDKETDSGEGGGVCDWDFLLYWDGSAVNAVPNLTDTPTTTAATAQASLRRYAAHRQLPDSMVAHFNDQEKLKRRELFAVGTLLYELCSLQMPFQDVSKEGAELLWMEGEFPDDVWTSQLATSILYCWCPEFRKDLTRLSFARFRRHVENRPGTFSLQVLGGAVAVASVITVPVLGAIGFSAIGPVAGSAAAGWQAGMGIVQAGSLFAWCQSAAMEGAAAGGLMTAGVSGTLVTAGATVQQMLGSDQDQVPPAELKKVFLNAWNRQAVASERHLLSIAQDETAEDKETPDSTE